MLSETACPSFTGNCRSAQKKILYTIVFVMWACAIFAQYKMSIKQPDNTSQDIWIHNITEITFTDVPFTCGTNTITYAGQTYNTVFIGNQCWLKENLNVGTRIDKDADQTNNSTLEKYCYSNNDGNCTTYGGLYQWAEAVNYQGGATNTSSLASPFIGNVQGICPRGWHIPTDAEFTTLKNSEVVGSNSNKLKAVGQGTAPGVGTNESGFSAMLAGLRYYQGQGAFDALGTYAYFWISTEYTFSTTQAYHLVLYGGNTDIYLNYIQTKANGLSVRCLKD